MLARLKAWYDFELHSLFIFPAFAVGLSVGFGVLGGMTLGLTACYFGLMIGAALSMYLYARYLRWEENRRKGRNP